MVPKKIKATSPVIMGILNVTPDSFSDGGQYFSTTDAVSHAHKMAAEGADIIDVGGESTRPGSDSVSIDEELKRVIPVIEKIVSSVDLPVSIDTTKPEVARIALESGAAMVNDVSMLRYDDALATIAAEHNAYLVLMHSRKTPKEMQQQIRYENVVHDVRSELLSSADRAISKGVQKDRIWLDPGIGFAKTAVQNLELIKGLKTLVDCGYPILVGPSRKSFIGTISGAEESDRLGGTAAAVAISIYNGAHAVRVHDIHTMKQAAIVGSAITGNGI